MRAEDGREDNNERRLRMAHKIRNTRYEVRDGTHELTRMAEIERAQG
jgi:hypothetical protein